MIYRWFRPLAIVLGYLVFGFLIGGTVGLAAPQNSPQLAPMGTSFTYQGYIEDNGSPANGSYDLRFSLYDDPSSGTLVAGPGRCKASPALT